jgi:hypothetical protein
MLGDKAADLRNKQFIVAVPGVKLTTYLLEVGVLSSSISYQHCMVVQSDGYWQMPVYTR